MFYTVLFCNKIFNISAVVCFLNSLHFEAWCCMCVKIKGVEVSKNSSFDNQTAIVDQQESTILIIWRHCIFRQMWTFFQIFQLVFKSYIFKHSEIKVVLSNYNQTWCMCLNARFWALLLSLGYCHKCKKFNNNQLCKVMWKCFHML